MSCYVKITDGIVIQKQPNEEDGFIEAPDDVIAGMLYDGESFTAPEITKTEQDIALENISRLESEITPRRLRDAVLGQENPVNWLADQEIMIAAERAKL